MATKKKQENLLTFNDEDVDLLNIMEAIRVRYDMYIGSLDPVHHLVNECIDNSVDEAMNGFCDTILVVLDKRDNSFTTTDNGRGLPLGIHPKAKIPTMEVLYTRGHAGAKFKKKTVKTSAGKNGIGLKAINACSSSLEVMSYRDGKIGTMKFSRGKVVEELTVKNLSKKEKDAHGTYNCFIPDEELFPEDRIKFDENKIRDILDLRCYLNPVVTIKYSIVDEKGKAKTEVIHHPNGLAEYLTMMSTAPIFNMEMIKTNGKDEDDNTYSAVFIWDNDTDENIISFVNSIRTERGTHESGFKNGLTSAINKFIKDKSLLTRKDKDLVIKGEDIRRGLKCIISVTHENPEFNSQTKTELTNSSISGTMKKILSEEMGLWLNQNEKVAIKICERIIAFARATNNAKNAMKNIVKISNNNSGLHLSSKFKDCMLENEPDKVEIIIIEGDSAGNTVEGARDYRFQCILPLKGKITNTYSASRDTLISSNEINEFLKVEFGTNDVKSIKKSLIAYINDGTDFYVKSKKIIVMSDADSDGKHIQNLFLAFVYTHLPEMIELGWIYIAKAPLYRVLVNKQYRYFMDDNDYNEFRSEIIAEKVKIHNKKWNVKRFMSKSQEFLDEYNRILNKFSIHPDILDWAMEVYNEEAYDLKLIEECGLDWNTNDDTSISIEGLYENIWHSFKLDELINEIEYLVTIYPFIETEVETIGQKEIEILSIHDSILYLSTFFRYTRNRLKGLGEMDADELKSTTLDPEVRSLIRVEKTDLDSEKDLFNIVFGNKTERRKDFLKELVFNMNE